jgi:preprotein translocase subunit SecD
MKITLRLWILIFALVMAFLLIFVSFNPFGILAFEKGVLIKSVGFNSSEMNSGISSGMIITEINGIKITNMEDYQKVNENLNFSAENKIIVTANNQNFIFLTSKPLTLTVAKIPNTNIKTGLDLSGGARALVRASNLSLADEQVSDLIMMTTERFNVYGLKDMMIRPVKDLSGENFMLIEIAGATPTDMENLVSSQGKFEARIGNQTLFVGGVDIANVEMAGQQSGIEGCYGNGNNGQYCRFRFGISITEEAAIRHADITSKLSLSTEDPEYLSQKLDLYLDGVLIDSLFISKNLKGQVQTEISIQGSGSGPDTQTALKEAEKNMKKLQTILKTGSLPYKLEIVKLDTISPTLGKTFLKNLMLLGLTAFILISVILFIKYRKVKVTLSVILTMFSEAFITLGISALLAKTSFGWTLDSAAIAGIIAGMGTGVNDQIIILDESSSGNNSAMKSKIKNAFFIILAAFFTIIAAMLPLLWAGAGMLRGFAISTIVSVLVGILITRPAFADIIKNMTQD